MKTFFKIALAFAGTTMCLSASYALSYRADPTTFLGPTLKKRYSSTFSALGAYSVSVEEGLKNFRGGGTVGFQLAEKHRIKISAEYLWQKITYPFFAGYTNEWGWQGAIGGLYQYRFCFIHWDASLAMRANFAAAPNTGLRQITGLFTNAAGVVRVFDERRRIAGSNAYGFEPGFTIHPWLGGVVGLALNYDNVRYDQTHPPSQTAVGFGGTARLDQFLTKTGLLSLTAAVRRPFNNYTASVNWMNVPYKGLSLGVFGAYTVGKNTLPNTWNMGISVSYYIDKTAVLDSILDSIVTDDGNSTSKSKSPASKSESSTSKSESSTSKSESSTSKSKSSTSKSESSTSKSESSNPKNKNDIADQKTNSNANPTNEKKKAIGSIEDSIRAADKFIAWISDPAVYMPEVLAIPDDSYVIR